MNPLRIFLIITLGVIFTSVATSQFFVRKEVAIPDFSAVKLVPKQIGNFFPPTLSAKSVLVVDLEADTVLFEKNPNLKLAPASLTKLATALVVLERCDKEQIITIPKIATPAGTQMGLVLGERIKVEDLLYGLLLPSGNDAANILTLACFDNFGEFLSSMEKFTQKLNMFNTQFKNPSGLPAKGHYSTAEDLLQLTKAILTNKTISRIIATKEKTVTDATGRIQHKLTNLNKLLENPQILGVKTGRTNLGESLIVLKDSNDHKIISIILQSRNRFAETEKILDWAEGNFVWEPSVN